MLLTSLSPWLPTAISKMVVLRIDRNYPSYVILISVPLGRVSEALPGFSYDFLMLQFSLGRVISTSGLSPAHNALTDHSVLRQWGFFLGIGFA